MSYDTEDEHRYKEKAMFALSNLREQGYDMNNGPKMIQDLFDLDRHDAQMYFNEWINIQNSPIR